jgi:hypothetical protein
VNCNGAVFVYQYSLDIVCGSFTGTVGVDALGIKETISGTINGSNVSFKAAYQNGEPGYTWSSNGGTTSRATAHMSARWAAARTRRMPASGCRSAASTSNTRSTQRAGVERFRPAQLHVVDRVDLRSHYVEQILERDGDLYRREYDDGHRHRQDGDPGPPGPAGQPRARDKDSGRRPELQRHRTLGDQRRADPLLPADSHPNGLPSRANPPPRQPSAPAMPVVERLNSIVQVRRREQPPQQVLVCRSSLAHTAQILVSADRYIEHTPSVAHAVG